MLKIKSDLRLQVSITPHNDESPISENLPIVTEDSNFTEVVKITDVAPENTQPSTPPLSFFIEHLETDPTLYQSLVESTNNELATIPSAIEKQATA